MTNLINMTKRELISMIESFKTSIQDRDNCIEQLEKDIQAINQENGQLRRHIDSLTIQYEIIEKQCSEAVKKQFESDESRILANEKYTELKGVN